MIRKYGQMNPSKNHCVCQNVGHVALKMLVYGFAIIEKYGNVLKISPYAQKFLLIFECFRIGMYFQP